MGSTLDEVVEPTGPNVEPSGALFPGGAGAQGARLAHAHVCSMTSLHRVNSERCPVAGRTEYNLSGDSDGGIPSDNS